jgi:hypothetical protein
MNPPNTNQNPLISPSSLALLQAILGSSTIPQNNIINRQAISQSVVSSTEDQNCLLNSQNPKDLLHFPTAIKRRPNPIDVNEDEIRIEKKFLADSETNTTHGQTTPVTPIRVVTPTNAFSSTPSYQSSSFNPNLFRYLTQFYHLLQLNTPRNKQDNEEKDEDSKISEERRSSNLESNERPRERSTRKTKKYYSFHPRQSGGARKKVIKLQNFESDSISQEKAIPVEEPALVEFTKEFPDWALSDIFLYLTTGQPRRDTTPIRRSSRPVLKSGSPDQERNNWNSEEELNLTETCRKYITDLLEMTEINENKIKIMLRKNDMKLERVIGTIKKNLPFYKKYFALNR